MGLGRFDIRRDQFSPDECPVHDTILLSAMVIGRLRARQARAG
jgi:hypothetical protein